MTQVLLAATTQVMCRLQAKRSAGHNCVKALMPCHGTMIVMHQHHRHRSPINAVKLPYGATFLQWLQVGAKRQNMLHTCNRHALMQCAPCRVTAKLLLPHAAAARCHDQDWCHCIVTFLQA
jgi:hypothetical protein